MIILRIKTVHIPIKKIKKISFSLIHPTAVRIAVVSFIYFWTFGYNSPLFTGMGLEEMLLF